VTSKIKENERKTTILQRKVLVALVVLVVVVVVVVLVLLVLEVVVVVVVVMTIVVVGLMAPVLLSPRYPLTLTLTQTLPIS
jgi:hypothetical protein